MMKVTIARVGDVTILIVVDPMSQHQERGDGFAKIVVVISAASAALIHTVRLVCLSAPMDMSCKTMLSQTMVSAIIAVVAAACKRLELSSIIAMHAGIACAMTALRRR